MILAISRVFVQRAAQRDRVAVDLDNVFAVQAGQLQEVLDIARVVARPHRERVADVVIDCAAEQFEADLADVLAGRR